MPTIHLFAEDFSNILGNYGEPPPITHGEAKKFLERLYGNQIRFSTNYANPADIQMEISDMAVVVDLYSRFHFSNSPCMAFDDLSKLLEITSGMNPADFRIVMVESKPIVCFKDKTLAMKVKLSIDNSTTDWTNKDSV